MKRFITFLFLGICSLSVAQVTKTEYRITGYIKGINSGKVYLAAFSVSNPMSDSAILKNGRFTFTGTLKEPTPFILSLERNFINKPHLLFFAENAAIQIEADTAHLAFSKVSGSAAQQDYAVYTAATQPFYDQSAILSQQLKNVAKDDTRTRDSITQVWEGIREKGREAVRVFIKEHGSSAVAAWAITKHFMSEREPGVLESLYNGLPPTVYYTSYAEQIKKKIDIEKRFAIGQPAQDFTLPDTSGKMVSLNEFKGKYVLLDFWASWCGPCRKENPNVVVAYTKYKDANFTVLGVSLDNQRQTKAWLNAIEKDGLPWTHVNDMNGAVAGQYGINSIPSNFLIAPDGKIVARNLEGVQLQQKLKELLQ